MSWQIPLADLDLDAAEEEALLAVLRRKWLTMGEETAQFETEFATYVGAKHAIAVTNCTAALHLAGLALGWGAGDEVIVPSLTFVATANSIRYSSATPIFADVVGHDDFSIDPSDVVAKITPRTRAIIVMHYGGYACNMPRIREIAQQYDLAVVEDAAHAPGSELNGRKLGTWGDIGCFSFFSNKNMTTGEGGMLTTDRDDLASQLRLLRSHGMTTLTWERHKGHAFSYDVVAPGYNYRIDEMRAALGRVQLRKLPDANRRRRELNRLYEEVLLELAPQVQMPYRNHPGVSACHIRPILLPPENNRKAFMETMKLRGVQTSIHYPPIHHFTHYREQEPAGGQSLPATESITAREVTLPLYPGMSNDDVVRVAQHVQLALQH